MDVKENVKKFAPHAIELRRQIHRNPELGWHEFKTTELIKQELASYGIEIQELPGLATGVTAVIRGGKKSDKTVGLREDIDGLPMTEETGLPFASTCGRQHACGHDIHTTALLLAARVLQEMRAELAGNVRLIFQPAEEVMDGARKMIATGFMNFEPKCNTVVGFHCSPEWDGGTIGLIKGPGNASTDGINITVKGKGGHGAHPYRCVDPVVTACYMVTQLQTLLSRENPAVQPAVLTFGKINGGTAMNIIPDEVRLEGTLRTFNEEGRHKLWDGIKRVADYSCKAMRAEAEVEIIEGVSCLYNDEKIIDDLRVAAKETIGAQNINIIPTPSPGSDDMALFGEIQPIAQFRVGTGNDNPNSRIGLHSTKNIFDEKAISVGATVMAQYALNFLK